MYNNCKKYLYFLTTKSTSPVPCLLGHSPSCTDFYLRLQPVSAARGILDSGYYKHSPLRLTVCIMKRSKHQDGVRNEQWLLRLIQSFRQKKELKSIHKYICSIAINLSREQSLVFTRLLGVQFWLFGCIPIDINPQYLALSDNFISDDNSVSSQIHIKTTWS